MFRLVGDVASQAKSLEIASNYRLVTIEELAEWAEALAALNVADRHLLETIIDARESSVVSFALHQLGDAADAKLAAKNFLGLLLLKFRSGTVSIGLVSRILSELANLGFVVGEGDDSFMLLLGDDIDLAERGIRGDLTEIAVKVDEFLAQSSK